MGIPAADKTAAGEAMSASGAEVRSLGWYLEALEPIDPRPVLAALAQSTGARSLLCRDLGLSQDEAEDARRRELGRSLAARALASRPSSEDGTAVTDLEVIEFLSGTSDPASAGFLLAQQDESVAPPRGGGMRVVVIGAGLSGIAAAIKLRASGHTVHILERNGGFGGTWLLNDYPGCRLDTGNFTYSYSFAHRRRWPDFYSRQREVLRYLEGVAAEHELNEITTFDAEVTSCVWDADRRVWTVTINSDSGVEIVTGDAVVSAIGQLGVPSIPRFAGVEDFGGEIVHSNRWRHDLDYAGKRVGVVGTGATGVQIAPELACDSGHLVVFQRSAPWLVPTPEYRRNVPAETTAIFDELPSLPDWYRFWQFWNVVEGRLGKTAIDDAWTEAGSVSAANAGMRETLAGYLREQLADRPDLLEKALPSYAPGSKRMVRDDGTWTDMIKRPNVRLETGAIESFTPTGVRLATGEEIPLDIAVFASGFAAADFLAGIEVRGTGGRELHEFWDGESRAYMGALVPGFPNFFMVYGPNTNLVANGSIMFMSECGVDYVRSCLSLLDGPGATVEVTEEAYEAFIAEMNDGNSRRAWGRDSVTNWYKNSSGVVTQVWPHSLIEFWQRTRKADESHVTVASANLAERV